MTDLAHLHEVEIIALKLGQAWRFLSGEQREFRLLHDIPATLQFAEFSLFMSMTVYEKHRTGGVGVLIQRADALRVAVNMFGLPGDEVQEEDLQDACAEACNVFSGCIALHVSGNQGIQTGLPAMANPCEYRTISDNSIITAVYEGTQDCVHVYVVVYDSLSQSA